MKKYILIFFLSLFMGNLRAEKFIVVSKDTTFTLEHPNSKDSMLVVNITRGVVNIVTALAPKAAGQIPVNNETLVGGIVAGVLWVWRRIELRRMRRRGRIKKDERGKLTIVE